MYLSGNGQYISSPTYKKVVTQFLAGNFYCKFGIYNAKSMFCQNIVPLGQLEAEILINLCSIKRSYIPDPIKRSYVTERSVLCTSTTMIFVWFCYTKIYISKHLASVHHNSSTLKGSFLRFYGSDPGDTTFWNSTNSFESEPLKICFLALLKSCTFWVTTFLYVGDDIGICWLQSFGEQELLFVIHSFVQRPSRLKLMSWTFKKQLMLGIIILKYTQTCIDSECMRNFPTTIGVHLDTYMLWTIFWTRGSTGVWLII